jgi:hypothetical protein
VADAAAQDAWVERVLGIRVRELRAAKSLVHRLEAVRDRANGLADPERYLAALRAVAIEVQQGVPEAAERLDRLETALASAERATAAAAAAEIAQARQGINAGVVAFAKIRLRWNAVQASRAVAAGRLGEVLNNILDAEFADDPEIERARAQVARIGERIPRPGPELQDALDDLTGAAEPAARSEARARALKAIAAYRRDVEAQSLLTDFQDTEYGSYRICDEIAGSLDALEAALRP